MIVNAQIEALRRDDGPQREAQMRLKEVMDTWRAHSLAGWIDEELDRFERGEPLSGLPALAGLFAKGSTTAHDFVDGLIRLLVEQLAQCPITQVPFRHRSDPVRASLVLAGKRNAALALQVVDGTGLAAAQSPRSICFAPSQTWERILTGEADAELVGIEEHRPGGVVLTSSTIRLGAGDVLQRDGESRGLILRKVRPSLVSLRLQRLVGPAGVTREFCLQTGDLVHQADASPRESRLELIAALLGKMGRGDAAPLLAGMAAQEAGTSLRWQSLKQCLGLDSALGFETLDRVARDCTDPLAGPCGALRAQLLEAHPQFAELV